MEGIIDSHGIIGFGDCYDAKGEEKRIVYLYDDDYTNEIKISSVPGSEITPQVLSSPKEYSLITVEEGNKKKTKIVSRITGFMAAKELRG